MITDHLAELCFASTDSAVDHLRREGIADERIVRTGDVMADAARIFGEQAEAQGFELLETLGLQAIASGNQAFVLATIHRAENTDDPARLGSILRALGTVATTGVNGNDPLPVLLPLHPRTKARIVSYEFEHLLEPLTLTTPLGFLAMVLLECRSSLVVTDSGGVQKEAFLQGTPCVTIRTETEWVELLDSGWNRLANPADCSDMLLAMEKQLLLDTSQPRHELYGNGHAAEEIMARLLKLSVP